MPKRFCCASERGRAVARPGWRGVIAAVAAVVLAVGLPGSVAAQDVRGAGVASRSTAGRVVGKPLTFGDLEVVRGAPESRTFRLDGYLILNGRKGYTLIPEGGVLHLPKGHRHRVAADRPEGPIRSWREFVAENREWVAAQEVPLTVARGVPSLLDPILGRLARERRVVIATYRNQPIAILHPVEEADGTAAANR